MSDPTNLFETGSTPLEWTFTNPSSGSTASPRSDFLTVDMSLRPVSTSIDGPNAISREERNMNSLREAVSKDPNWARVVTSGSNTAVRSQIDRSLQILDRFIARGLSHDTHLHFKDDGLATKFKLKPHPHPSADRIWSLKIIVDEGAPFSGECFVPDRADEPLIPLTMQDRRKEDGTIQVGCGKAPPTWNTDDNLAKTLGLDDRWSKVFSSALEIQPLSLSSRNRNKGDALVYGIKGWLVEAGKTSLEEETKSGIRYNMLFVPTDGTTERCWRET
ncbi:hypothetical protein I302_104017 [Kwoniella bestiolae CBS 10118]|uniref:Uncharacterized protein n=1 Tax=Kwoniella bestiolae CBS 10118 TaxID=1296100 RepID=A0A1B9GA13_9TREE|nr:hypothetical protein I302_02722 [Kwoniella bestiolae CBS 10118]OCF27872.1 hypothetical protein I302_02722 [Kwoniella bestiolae CBS 10118]